MAASFCRRAFLRCKNRIPTSNYSTGYVILIPESPEEVVDNAIFNKSGHLVDLNNIGVKECKALLVSRSQAYDVGTWDLGEALNAMMVNNEKIDLYKNVIGPLEMLFVPFQASLGLIQTLQCANSTYMPFITYFSLMERAAQIREEKFNVEPVYKICKKFLEEEPDKFTVEEKRVMQKYVWGGNLNGLGLDQKNKLKIADLGEKIKMRVGYYTVRWKNAMMFFKQIIQDPKAAVDFPPDLLRYTAYDVENPEKGPWVLSLQPKIYNLYMQYCDARQGRLHMWLSRRQICSRHGDPRFRSDMEVEDLREKRNEIATLLGYPTYAHMVMKNSMAGDLENVHDVLATLLEKARLGQEVEINSLEEFAKDNYFVGQIELWDIDYWARVQKKELFHFDEVALQEYFPLGQVLLGLFALCEGLFGIIIEEEKNIRAWHEDVRFFRVLDEKTKQDLGGFYFDPYARKSKCISDEPGGAVFVIGMRSTICNTLPSMSLIFEFAPPTEDKPSLLLFREVEDLFLKFGACLQHILTEANHVEVSGFHNLEHDAIAVCAKFLRHWVYERGTLESVSGHYNTGEPLPSHILDGIVRMKEHMAGTKLCLDIYDAHLDLNLSIDNECCMPIVEKLWPQHFLFDLLKTDHHPFSMKDIFVSNRACTYYGKIWSDMVAADIFSSFEEAGFTNHEEVSQIGRRFRSTYYALAGSCSASEVFKKFRGRDPSPLPLLGILGLKDLKPSIESSTETAVIDDKKALV